MAPRGWPGPADAVSPVFPIDAADLWRAWMDLAARQPRTVLRAQDERTLRSLHVQRSRVLHFPDLVRAEIVARAARSASCSTAAPASAAGISASTVAAFSAGSTI